VERLRTYGGRVARAYNSLLGILDQAPSCIQGQSPWILDPAGGWRYWTKRNKIRRTSVHQQTHDKH